MSRGVDNPVCIAVMDLQSGKVKKVKVPGAIDYIFLNFVE